VTASIVVDTERTVNKMKKGLDGLGQGWLFDCDGSKAFLWRTAAFSSVTGGTARVGLALLASSIALVGCGGSCNNFRSTTMGSTDWPSLQRRAHECLGSGETTALERQHARYAKLVVGKLFERDHTVQDLIDEDRDWAANAAEGERVLQMGNEGIAQIPSATNPSQSAMIPPGPWVLQSAVQFVFPDADESADSNSPIATSFVLRITENAAAHRPMFFLVTDRHVVQPSWAQCSPDAPARDPTAIRVQFRNSTGGWSLERVSLRSSSGEPLYRTLPDSDVDLALVLLTTQTNPSLATYRFLSVPFTNVASDQELAKVNVNATVMAAGLQPDVAGRHQNLPVFKSGMLSSKRSEPTEIPCTDPAYRRMVSIWVVQAPFTSGMSGAPVFTVVNRGPNKVSYPILIGVQSIGWPNTDGLAGITPASHLVDLVTRETSAWNVDLSRQ
jgi:hypothetical protein